MRGSLWIALGLCAWPRIASARDVLATCGCTEQQATCSIPGAAGASDHVRARAAGADLSRCASDGALAGYTIRIAGHYEIQAPIVLPPDTKLVGAQALKLDGGRPVMAKNGPPGCEAWGHERCFAPVLRRGATPTVIAVVGPFGEAAVTVQARGQASRFTVTHDGAMGTARNEGIWITGPDATVSEVDAFDNGVNLRVFPCREADVAVDRDGAPRCTVPVATNVRVVSSVMRYSQFHGVSLLSGTEPKGYTLSGIDFGASFESNVITGAGFYGLFMRVWSGSNDCTLDVTTRNNWVFDNYIWGMSINTRYGGDRNFLSWRSEGDLLEGNSGGVDVATCEAEPPYCNDNTIEARFEDLVVRGSFEGPDVNVVGVAPADSGGFYLDNRAHVTLQGASFDGFVSCLGDEWNEGALVGSTASILAANDLGFGYVPAQCTTDPSDQPVRLIEDWLVLGMYANPDGRAASDETLRADHLADGTVTQETLVPAEGMELGLPIAGAFVGPGERPTVARISPVSPEAGAEVDLNGYFQALCAPEDAAWGCAESTLEDWEPPGFVAAYLFTYVENLTGGPLPVDVALASDNAAVVTLRGIEPPGEPETTVVNVAWALDGLESPGVLRSRVPATVPPGTSLLSVLVSEGQLLWAARVVLLEPGTDRSVEALGLLRYDSSPP
jgi:hypothetical protein